MTDSIQRHTPGDHLREGYDILEDILYWYRARLSRVVDGDTVILTLDMGYDLVQEQVRVRLADVDAAETWRVPRNSEEYARGVEHTEFTTHWLSDAAEGYEGNPTDSDSWPLLFDSQGYQRDGWSRSVGYIYRVSDGDSLTQALIDEYGDEVIWNP